MDSSSALPQQVIEALDRDSIILTANQRAARTVRRAFDLRQHARGRTYWNPPIILAWDSWTASLWGRLIAEGCAFELLLSPTQEHTLWRAIIAADAATASLRPIDSLAETAADAWALLHVYRGRNRLFSFPGNADTAAFARWAGEFERRCGRSRYLTQAQLPEALRAALADSRLTIQSEFLLVGFDSKTPAQTALLDAVRASGGTIDDLGQPPTAPDRTLADAPDEHAELTACARWLRTRLTDQPNAGIAVIVPNIEADRAEIDRVFRPILAPELEDIAAPAASGPYEFSLGVPLAHTPMVAAALDILRWANDPLPLDRVCSLLLSPHFAAASPVPPAELLARAEFDAFTLRQEHLLQPEIALDALYALAAGSRQISSMPLLRDHLRVLRPLFGKRYLAGERSYAEWAATIHELLQAAGWALSSHLDSIEFQTRRKWEGALDELTTLDFDSASDGAQVSFAEALGALERIAGETLFAPESRHAPIQIMGPLESAGSSFDAIWFLRANDLAWPPTPGPNPLLPWLLQRELAMPGVDPAADTARFRRITERIAASAPTVLFSYARTTADSHQRPSPLLAPLDLDLRPTSDIAAAPPAPAPIALDAFADDEPIPPPPDRILQGGAGILQSQAQCGFRAFAEKRLYSSALDPASLGLDPSERGSLVHSVLERFWAEVETQAALKRMPLAGRNALLTRSIEAALAEHHPHPDPGWPIAYLAAERQRLFKLLGLWLDYEATKRPPFTVRSREERLEDVRIGPLRLDIRVDRVDEAQVPGSRESAGEIILDYKTGVAKPADWLGPRPDAPQLPLYAVVSQIPHLAAVAFASVRPGKYMDINGYQARIGILPKCTRLKTDSLKEQVDEWREVLVTLASEFHSSTARVSPKQYPQTCQYCEQRLLCRLEVAALDPEVLEDNDADSDLSDPAGMEADFG